MSYLFQSPESTSLDDFKALFSAEELSLFYLNALFQRTGRSKVSTIIQSDALFAYTHLTTYQASDDIQVIIDPASKVVYSGALQLCTFLKYGQPQDHIRVSLYDPTSFEGTELEAYTLMPKHDLVVEAEDGWRGMGNLLMKLCHDPDI